MKELARRLLKATSLGLLGAHRLAFRHPRAVVAVTVLLTLFFAFELGRLRILFAVQDMVGNGVPTADELTELKDRFEDGASSVLLVTPPRDRPFTAAELCGMRRWYSAVRTTEPELRNSFSSFDVSRAEATESGRIKYRNALRLDCDRETLGVPYAEAARELNEGPWPALRDGGGRLSLVFGFTFRDSEDPKFGSFNPQVLRPLRESMEKRLRPLAPEAAFHWVGTADYQWYVLQGFRFSMVVNSAMIVLLIVASRLLYGTWLSGLLYCGTLFVCGIWVYGAKALFGSPYDMLSSGIFLLLGVACLEDFTFISAEQMKGRSWRTSMRRVLVPGFWTSVLTVIGFASLYTSDLDMIAEFGLWSALGALLEWAMLFVALPAVLRLFRRQPTWVDPSRAYGRRLLDELGVKAIPRWLARAAMIVFPLAVLASSRINPNDSLTELFPRGHPYTAGIGEMLDSRGWQGVVSLVMERPGEPVDRALERLAADPVAARNVAASESASKVLEWLRRPGGLPPETVALDYRGTLSSKQLVDDGGTERAQLYLRDVSVLAIQDLKARVNEACRGLGCHLGGDLVAYSDIATHIPTTLIGSMSSSVAMVGAVVAFLAMALGKGRQLPALLLSAFWGPCFMLIIMAALQIPMDFLKCVFASTLVGLAGDNAIHYLYGSESAELREGVEENGTASVTTAAMMAATSLLYLASYFEPPKIFGVIMATGLMAGLVGDLWLLNGLLPRGRPKSLSSGAPTPASAP